MGCGPTRDKGIGKIKNTPAEFLPYGTMFLKLIRGVWAFISGWFRQVRKDLGKKAYRRGTLKWFLILDSSPWPDAPWPPGPC